MADTQVRRVGGPMSPAKSKLIDALKGGKPGDRLTDEQTSAIAGINTSVGEKGYGHLNGAINYVRKNHRVVWERIRTAKAIQCLDNDGKIRHATGRLAHVRRQGKAVIQTTAALDMASLDDASKSTALALTAQAGVIVHFAGTKTTRQLENRKVQPELDYDKLLGEIVQK